MKSHGFLAICLICLSTSAAQVTVGIASDAPSREDVLRLFAVMQVRQTTEIILKNSVAQAKKMNEETLKKRMPNATREQLDQMHAMMDELFTDLPIQDILETMVPVYQRHFSKTDLHGIAAFYSSPVGQKFMQQMPAITTEAMQASYPILQQYLEVVEKRIDERVRKMGEQGKQTPARN